MEQYIITGRKGTGTHPRVEIRELELDQRQWTLFILAFQEIQSCPHPFYSSFPAVQFAQMAGIHGLPYEKWIGDPEGAALPLKDSKWKGYCNHRSILFPTWHRPCVLLIEQAIGEAAVRIAESFVEEIEDEDERERWLTAAKVLRFPYWDWTDPRTELEGLPEAVMHPTVSIHVPCPTISGNPVRLVERKVQNPLACYRFGKTLPAGFKDRVDKGSEGSTPSLKKPALYAVRGQTEKVVNQQEKVEGNQPIHSTAYFARWDRTYRWPQPVPENPVEDYAGLNAELRTRAKSLRDQVASLFTFPIGVEEKEVSRIWDEFSNGRFQSGSDDQWPTPYAVGSLESPHDSLHLILGGIGFMADPDYAGFDPIFYLHHANVDRIVSLWEYVYPEYWMGKDGYSKVDGLKLPFTQEDGSWTSQDEGILDEDTVLAPFRMTRDAYWTSKTIRSLELVEDVIPKYYTYPEVAGIRVDQSQAQLGLTPADRERLRLAVFNHFSLAPTTPTQALQKHETKLALAVELQQSSTIRNGSYRLDIYFNRSTTDNEVEAEAKQKENKTFVGSVAVFARQDTSACGACEKRKNVKGGMRVRGVVPIPSGLVDEIARAQSSPSLLSSSSVAAASLRTMQDDDALVQMVKALMDGLSGELTKPGGGRIYREVNVGNDTAVGVDGIGKMVPLESEVKVVLLSRTPTSSIQSDATTQASSLGPWKSHGSLSLLRIRASGLEGHQKKVDYDYPTTKAREECGERGGDLLGTVMVGLGAGVVWVWGVVKRSWLACF